ncbi:Ig-like domain-containing protein [Tenacibaculum sp. TC6]|uniref:Ig-like domain-containing protein n=1 Tax=Tenacibaculum sp. TC6 TaxID=3423223 RepID=UPI003D36D351
MTPFLFIRKRMLQAFFFFMAAYMYAQVNTGGSATTANHQKQVIGYISNWDAWKDQKAGVPAQGALTHLNIDYSKYTILNYSFFGVARDGSLHSGDHRNKNIYQSGVTQEPKDLFFTDIYSSWDLHILFGEIDPIQYINQDAKTRAEAQGFQVELNGTTWTHPTWGLSGSLPLPLHKETGAPGLLELAHQKGVKVMASIGGWSMCKHFPEMAADPVKRAKFIEDCKKLIATGFDGIDLDWEYPGPYSGMNFTGTNADFANFEALVEEIRAAIGPDKLITAAMSADPRKLDGFNWTRLAASMNYFNMMTYDMNGGWSNIAGHNAPVYPYTGAEVSFFNWQSTLQKLTEKGVPTNKICMGAPFYGRGVVTNGAADLNVATVKRSETVQPDGPIVTAADYTNWPKEVYDGTPNYFFIKQKALSAGSGWTKKWDNEAKAPYLVKGNYFLSYDDEESIGIKAQFINDYSLGGTIVWTVYGDLEFGGSVTSFGTKLKRWSDVKSPLVNKINEVFANGNTGGNVAPTVSITSPANNAAFAVGDNVVITANATDSNGTVTKVEFFNGATKLGEDTTSPYSFTISNAVAGTYQLTAKATDNDNASTVSTQVTISVTDGTSNVPPVVVITSPAANASFNEGEAVTITANATDSDGTVAKVEFFNGAAKVGEATASPYSYVLNGLTEGTHVLTAKATDDKGAITTSDAVSITVTKDSGDVCSSYPVWSASATYTGGNDVKYNNVHYRAKWWTQNDNPEDKSGADDVWKKIGPCGGATDPTNELPVVSITSPANNASFDEGATIEVQANASDADGTIAKVEFFNGTTKLGEDTTSPYSFTISNAVAGTYTLHVKATDDKNGVATSSNVSVTVKTSTTGGGDCGGVPQYAVGTSYSQNQEVQNEGEKYKCNVPGWCSSTADWAYAPGTGTYWQDAWAKVGTCGGGTGGNSPLVSITSPLNGSTYSEGASFTIQADASDSDGTVTKVEFFNGVSKLGEDTTSPYSFAISNAQAGSYSLTAVATDNDNNQTTSTAVIIRSSNGGGGNGTLPGKILVGYWHNFNNGSSTPRLSEVSTDWDVICIAFAEPRSGSTSDMVFNPYEIYSGNVQAFINDVATVRNRGQKVLISIGGANARVELNTEAEKNEFVNSMTAIINTYGFDGMDIDLEGSSLSLNSGDTDFRNPTTPKIINLIAATKSIRNNIGASFILSMAPETAYVQGAYGNYSGVFGAYLPVIHALQNEMNYIHVQHYNTGSMFGRDGRVYQPATADFHVAMAEMLITGFPVAQTGLTFPGLRADQVAIGLPSTTQAAGSGYTSEAVVQQALDYLIKGVSYSGRTYTTAATYPDFRGLMTWSINWDVVNNAAFSSSHRAYLDSLGAQAKTTKEEVVVEEEVRITPNPVAEKLTILNLKTQELRGGSNETKIQIFDVNGSLMFESIFTSSAKSTSFDVSFLKGGLYFYSLENTKKKHIGKFIKVD